MFFLLLDIRLFKINRQGDMAAWTVNDRISLEGLDIILGTSTTEFMTTTRPNGFFGGFVANATHKNILSTLRMLLQNQIRVVGDLAHLHDETEDVGVVVQHDTAAHVGIELSSGAGHDALGKISLDLAKEFVVQDHTK